MPVVDTDDEGLPIVTRYPLQATGERATTVSEQHTIPYCKYRPEKYGNLIGP